MNTGRTHFKKGCTPWNKGKTGIMKAWNKGTKGIMKAWNKGLYGLNSGEDNPNWKGGSSYLYSLRRTSRYADWRTLVFERDQYICQMCGFVGNRGYLTAHHVESIKSNPDRIFDIENGITLCETCHSQTDNYKGRARRTN